MTNRVQLRAWIETWEIGFGMAHDILSNRIKSPCLMYGRNPSLEPVTKAHDSRGPAVSLEAFGPLFEQYIVQSLNYFHSKNKL